MGFFDFLKNKSNNLKDKKVLKFFEPKDENLKNEVIEFIKQEILFGFNNKEDILEAIWSVGFENEEQLDENWLKKIISDFYISRQNESKEWKKPTDFDKLAKVFDELNRERIVALHKAGYTKQDGYSDVRETLSLVKANVQPIGFCFYHTQDLERAIDPTIKNLFLAFDDIKQNDENAIKIKKLIVKKLNENGLQTEWNERTDERIKIKGISWQKTPDNRAWGITRTVEELNKSE